MRWRATPRRCIARWCTATSTTRWRARAGSPCPSAISGAPPGAAVGATLRPYLAALMGPAMQRDFIPLADGQPSAREAWADARVNAAWNGFYAQTQATLEQAIVRPRHPG